MTEIRNIARCAIHPGKLGEFKALAERCTTIVRQKDKGTLGYDWYFSADETVCVVHERYRDSAAVLQHVANLGDALGQLLGLCDLSIETYGEPSAELVKASAGMKVAIYKHYKSL